jgi:hypothetical protein
MTEIESLNIIFKDDSDLLWVDDDICKMRTWSHKNTHIEDIPATHGAYVNIGGSTFKVTDVNPVIGWALGTCWELTAKRQFPDDSDEQAV